ncbi:MAG: response regulator [Pseudomonadota bacterium]
MTEGAKLNTFLVEDNEDTRDIVVEAMETLTSVRFVSVATDEPSARKWLQDHEGQWNLAIVDLMLLDGSGMGVLKACRSRSPMQKVVVLTGHTDEGIVQRCRDLGADQVFDKSTDIASLVDYCKVHATYLGFMQDHGLVTDVDNP